MRKQIVYALLATVAAAGLFLLVRSQKVVKNEAYYEAVSKYIYAFTSGSISRNDVVRVRFVNAAVSQDQVGKDVPANVFSTDPKIEGKAVWEDDRTIKLTPAKALTPGKRYTAHVSVQRIYADAPSLARSFEFDFNVRELAYDVVTNGLSADPNDPHQQRVTGRIRVNESCEAAKIEQMFAAKQGNKALLVSWQHSQDGQSHDWTVAGVERSNAASSVRLAWSGAPIGVEKSITEEQVVPPLGEFVVLSAKAIQVEEQYVLLNFSDPISAAQDLSGLVRIANYNGKLRYVTDGNFVRVYPGERITGAKKILVDGSIRSAVGQSLNVAGEWTLNFEDLKPGVRLVGRGAIIPQQSNGGVIFPFEAVGLTSVDVEVFKIFNSNILQFLQVNEIEGEEELQRVGKIVLQKKFDLAAINPDASSKVWQRYALDLKDMIQKDPGAIYQVRLAFKMDYTACSSVAPAIAEKEEGIVKSIFGGYRGIYWDEDDSEGWWSEEDDYNWDNREVSCAKEYYNSEHFSKRNVFVSDLGLTAKRGHDGSIFLAVTDLHTAQPVSGIDIELLSYQLQPITKTRTEGDGTVMVEGLRETPFLAVATGQGRRGYLRMADGNALSLSRFDVAGVEAQKGLKGYIYGERGVWRPGDSLYLNFVLEDKTGRLPQGHPVVFELRDPGGALQYRRVQTTGVNGVYPFYRSTRADAKTGNWNAKVLVGGATFTRQVKVETVKPNRLKMDLNFGPLAFLTAKDFAIEGEGQGINGALKVNWLHGAAAQNLKAKVEMQVRAVKTEFTGYKGYTFDDPSRYFNSDPEILFEDNLDQAGLASVPLKIGEVSAAPGKLIANFKVRAFEAGGDFSTDNFALDVLPYDRFVGVFIPTDKWGSKTLDRNGSSKVNFAVLNTMGKPVPNHKVTVALYRVDWRWWWDDDAQSGIGQFNSSELNDAVAHAELTTDARGQATWTVKPSGWGRYLVRIADTEEGHTAGDFFWAGQPEQLDDIASRNAAAMLPFTVEKEKYNVGEEVVLKVPASENGRILLTLETGTRVARHFWFDAVAGDNFLKFKAEKDMAPTVYAHVSLIQPHAQTKNDLPIRMYGVTPVNVENPATRLEAQIDMPDQLKPDEFFNIALREKGGKACVYTLDVVDEGLLDLTRFKTPNPWNEFYAREAHGVKTWDIYDYVLGAYGAELSRILAIGGDGINQKAKNATQVNRFKPCVLHLGPFKLEKGQVAKHRLKIENYVGSVRVMAVLSAPAAGGEGSYGNAEKTCPVRKPLMIMPTLPRVLGPGETLRLPVEVFAMEKSVNNAIISVREKSGLVSISGAAQNTLAFTEPGQKLTYFDLKVGQKTGVARFSITATGGGETATSEIELEVRNPNPVITRVLDGTIEPGQSWSQTGNTTDFSDLEAAALEISSIPPINLSKQLDYLIQYPHGCVEQTTSAAFPQLYVDLIAPLSEKQQKDIQTNVSAAIAKLQNFQMASGAFSYWVGGNEVADWAGTYAGHFLMEAKARGYAVPQQLLDKWIDYQTKASRSWEPGKDNDPHGWGHHDNEMSQAYRLYTLALAGKPDLAGMNRLREQKTKFESSASLLAAAYASAGKNEAARDLLNDVNTQKYGYTWWGYTYGSDLRDLALKLETLTAVGDNKRGLDAALQVASQVGDAARWYSTQELATCLRALCKFAKKATFGEKSDFVIKSGGREIPVNSTTSYYLYPLGDEVKGGVSVKNLSKQKLYARIVMRGRPVAELTSEAKNISLGIRYTDLKGSAIDPAKLKQGTDFLAEVTVTRTGEMKFDFNELALTQMFPSGWEILNTRMSDVGGGTSDPMDYQDVRDDRVMTYFDLPYNWSNDKNLKQSRTYRIQLNAAYAGRYYLPAVACEAMYDNRIRAVSPGKWVEVLN